MTGLDLRKRLWRVVLASLAIVALLGGGVAGAAAPSPLSQTLPAGPSAVVDALQVWVAWGDDHPDEVLRRLDTVATPADVPADLWARLRLRSQGMVAARSGLVDEVNKAVAGLRKLQRSHDDPLLAGDVAMIGALQADNAGESEQAAGLAAQADQNYQQACAAPANSLACDHNSRWEMLRALALRSASQGHLVEAYALQERALAVAEGADDLGLQAVSQAQLALLSHTLGEPDKARRQIRQAERLLRQSASPAMQVRVDHARARLLVVQGDDLAARQQLLSALATAQRMGSARLIAWVQMNLSDSWLRAGRPHEALAAVEQALPVLRRHHDLRNQAAVLHNGGLARLGLGQAARGRADLEEALALWQSNGAKALMELALHEHSDALAKIGDVTGALALYHREQALRVEIQQANREAMLAQLKGRFQGESERRELELLTRENVLKASEVRTQNLLRQVWTLGALLMVLVGVAVAILVRRARDANGQLRRSEALLKVQTERDPLTGLANRRHLRDVMAARADTGAPFNGALLLLDIDHFKRINDSHGHGAGDQVLTELARRLSEAVRSGDLACRWGGEEFLIYAPDLQGDSLDALVKRLLGTVGDQPVSLGGGLDLRVTASLGYASFPLPPQGLTPDWEQAVNLVDLALYTAKSGGRDRAVRLSAAAVPDVAALAQVEREFQQAHRDGRITLDVLVREALP